MSRSALWRSPLLILLAIPVLLSVAGTAEVGAQPTTATPSPADPRDRQAVRRAALDYVEALYEVDSTRIVRSVHPDLRKYGYYRRDGAYRGTAMTFKQLRGLATRWNQNQGRVDPDSATKNVVVLDVLDKTASAKVVAQWGIDYMHLAKVDGKWMIRQVLWQSHPPTQ